MPSASVTIFNTSSIAVHVSVNNGQQFSIGGASVDWRPSPTNGGPAWSDHGPGPNTLGPGTNVLTVTSQGGQPIRITVSLSGSQQWSSVQLYLFLNWGSVSWVALNAGQYIAGGQ
jgi:hypothetical protein